MEPAVGYVRHVVPNQPEQQEPTPRRVPGACMRERFDSPGTAPKSGLFRLRTTFRDALRLVEAALESEAPTGIEPVYTALQAAA